MLCQYRNAVVAELIVYGLERGVPRKGSHLMDQSSRPLALIDTILSCR